MKTPFTPQFKAKVALEAVKEIQTTGQIASKFQVLPIQVGMWKKQFIDRIERIFSEKNDREKQKLRELNEELYTQVGKREIEIEWLKKKVEQFK
jgi:transposase